MGDVLLLVSTSTYMLNFLLHNIRQCCRISILLPSSPTMGMPVKKLQTEMANDLLKIIII